MKISGRTIALRQESELAINKAVNEIPADALLKSKPSKETERTREQRREIAISMKANAGLLNDYEYYHWIKSKAIKNMPVELVHALREAWDKGLMAKNTDMQRVYTTWQMSGQLDMVVELDKWE